MMKVLSNIPVFLLAIIYLVFGANFFLHFIPMPPATGNAATFFGVIYSTGFLAFVKILEIVLGALLLINATRPLALLLIAPISLNILLFEVFIANQPGIGILLVILNALAIYHLKSRYIGIVKA